MKNYLRLFKNYFTVIPGTAAVSLVYYLSQGLLPAFTAVILAELFDTALAVGQGEGGGGRLMTLGVVYLAVYLGTALWTYIADVAMSLGADKNQVSYRHEICKTLAKLPLLDFEDSGLRDKHRRAEDCLYSGMMNRTIQYILQAVLLGAVNLISVSAVLARYSLWFLPLCVLSVLPYLIARLVRGREFYSVKRGQAKRQRRMEYLWRLFTDRKTIKELRVFGADDYVFDRWREVRDETQEEIHGQLRRDARSYIFCDILRIVGYGTCIALALALTVRGDVSVGVFGACIAAFLSLQNTMRNILQTGGELPSLIKFTGDYFEFVDLEPEQKPGAAPGLRFGGLRYGIELRSVSFRYPNAADDAVRGVSMSIKKGEKIAVLGENGSGKTTLTKLLLGLLPVSGGEVLYDGVDVNALDKASFYRTVSAVSQDFVRYALPLRENIAMSDIGRLNDDAAIGRALRDAGLSELAGDVGLDAEIGNAYGGADISGGQWQKLAIARGLFRPSEFIILDEPTSALDPLIETEILSRFIDLARDKTAVIISHRVGLCRLVDRIAVMKDGALVEFGTHEDLLSLGGEYARLFTAQEKWYR
ncbi:MAG: ABC transporter ATP-binding protein/permease [Oscillospiraceae bacterium]|jgi:ABC-type multidrug transport system fused ATPase/permease subunit|nr:ABC transporter ATP-binding protein/permease [Oscillospiraceae bacterium]